LLIPKNDQPYSPYVGPLLPYQNVRVNTINRFSGYGQWRKDKVGSSEVWYNARRIHNWEVTGADVSGSAQTTFSPRAQFAIKPDWEKIWSLGFQEVYTISHRSTESLEMLQEWYSQCKSTTIRSFCAKQRL
jgi:hypothetical protein